MQLHYPNMKIGGYVIMPDHIHMILIFSDNENGRMISAPTKPVSTVVVQMKRWVSKEIGFLYGKNRIMNISYEMKKII